MSIALRLTTRAELGEDARAELKRLLMGVYGFRKVDVEVTCKLPGGDPFRLCCRVVPCRRPRRWGEEGRRRQGLQDFDGQAHQDPGPAPCGTWI